MSRLDIFLAEYRKQLELSHKANPTDYAWDITELNEVFGRMKNAILRGSFNKDSIAFRKTCKALKIKHTYRDIKLYLGGES